MVLVGPAGAGKSTLGREVAARTHRPFVDLDAVADAYYAQVGWSVALLRERIAAVGRVRAEAEWEPARAHAVVRAVADHPGAVVALGAGHTSYADRRHLATVRAALGRCREVVRVLPSADREVSLDVLRRRCEADKGRSWVVDGHDFLAHWLDDAGARLVATRTIHTGDESPDRTAARLI
ncbi:shikimate kinase [Streptomyces sp. Amel2xC10]|uniref:shikimate kinase n=1 Tax=Streptomyces sp. Amel2xC10 TaxID=1305826 RepID=UPI000A087BCA|nr:shikimate kinase [Streptomyces sp. Amel2xC10]SMF49291.1 shikimate kinase [Streptomyces sp. Amel2xC10]